MCSGTLVHRCVFACAPVHWCIAVCLHALRYTGASLCVCMCSSTLVHRCVFACAPVHWYIAVCLHALRYTGAPLCVIPTPLCVIPTPQGSEGAYRSAVQEAIPHLRILDDTPLSDSGATHRQSEEAPPTSGSPTHPLKSESSLFRLSEAGMGEDVQVVMEGLRKGGRRGEGEGSPLASCPSSARPKTAPIHGTLMEVVFP